MKPPDKRDRRPGGDGLLDPDSFWDTDTKEKKPAEEAVETDDDVAVVVSATSQPEELYLPRAEREIRPAPARPKPRPPPVVREPLSTDEKPRARTSRIWVVPVVIGLLLALGLLAWQLLSDRTPADPGEKRTVSSGHAEASQSLPTAASNQDSSPVADSAEKSPKLGALRTGTLKLTSDPPGAVVFLNDEKRGATPTIIKDIEAGSVLSLRIEAEGYRPWTHTVSFDGKDLKREFHAGLLEEDVCQEGSGWVYVTSEPPGATVELDKKRLPGKTPMVIDSVCAGVQHSIRLQARGFRTWFHSFEVTPGQVMNLNADLKK